MVDLIRRLNPAFLPCCAVLLTLIAGLWMSLSAQSTQNAQPYFTEPSISPDEIAFVSDGDI